MLFALTKAPQYANLDYMQAYGGELDKALTSVPEADLRFVINGRGGPNQGIAGVILKPWDERKRSAAQIKPELQKRSARSRACRPLCSHCRPCRPRSADCRYRWS